MRDTLRHINPFMTLYSANKIHALQLACAFISAEHIEDINATVRFAELQSSADLWCYIVGSLFSGFDVRDCTDFWSLTALALDLIRTQEPDVYAWIEDKRRRQPPSIRALGVC